jgi:ethanolamine utilization protein EutS
VIHFTFPHPLPIFVIRSADNLPLWRLLQVEGAMETERIIQEFVPGKQVTLAHLIAHPGDELAKKIGVPGAEAIGIMTLTPGETAMIAGDFATKAADVHIGFLDRFSGALVIYGSVGAVEESLNQTVTALGRTLNYTLCTLTKS